MTADRRVSDPLPPPEEKRAAVREMFDRISGTYDRVNRIMSLGMDMRWRKETVAKLQLPAKSLVLDVACGTGDICRLLADVGYRPVGVDLSLGMLENARTQAPLLEADALALPFPDASVDGMTCGFGVRNFTDISVMFAESARVIRPGGRFAFLEVSQPKNKILKFGHHIYFDRVVPTIGGWLVDKQAYHYLPKSVAYLPPPHELAQLLSQAGFKDIEHQRVGAGAAQILSATRT